MVANKSFNLTGKLTILTPNLGDVAADIKSKLGGINTSININIKTSTSTGLTNLATKVQTLNVLLAQTTVLARDAKAAMDALGASWRAASGLGVGGRAGETAATNQATRATERYTAATTAQAAASRQAATASQQATQANYTMAESQARVAAEARAAEAATRAAAQAATAAARASARARAPIAAPGTPYGGTASGRVGPPGGASIYMGGQAPPRLTPTNTVGSSNAEWNRVAQNINRVGLAAKQARGFMYDFGRSGALALKRFGAFTLATTVVFGFIYAVINAVKEAIKFEAQLIKIVQVSSKFDTNISIISQQITSLSKNFGVASSSLVDIGRILTQAGLRGRDFSRALDAIAKSDTAPTFTNMTNTAEGLIASFNQFELSSSDFEKSLGSINAVAGKFAVEADDIIGAVRKAGGVFAQSSKGVSEGIGALQEFIAVFTSVRATTRESADSVATGLRTIFTRIQRPKSIELLREYGIELRDVEGNFIGAYKAIDELGKNLQNLDPRSERFFQIAEALGGFRQIGKTLPLLTQFEKRQEALKIAMGGTDSLSNDSVTAMQGLGRQIKSVSEDFKALIREITQTSTFRLLAKSLLDLATGFVAISRALTPLIPLLTAFTTIKIASGLMSFFAGVRSQFSSNGGGRGTPTPFGQNLSPRAAMAYYSGARGARSSGTEGVFGRTRTALGRIGRRTGITGGGLAVGSLLVGGYLSSSENSGARVAGGALTGAGLGYMVGGPAGAAIGALVIGSKAVIDAFNANEIEKSTKKVVDSFNTTSSIVQKYNDAKTKEERERFLPDLKRRSEKQLEEFQKLGRFQKNEPNALSKTLANIGVYSKVPFDLKQAEKDAEFNARVYQEFFTRTLAGGRKEFDKAQEERRIVFTEGIVGSFDTDSLRKQLLDVGIDKLVKKSELGTTTGLTKIGQDLLGIIQPALFGQGTQLEDINKLSQLETAKNPEQMIATLLVASLSRAQRDIQQAAIDDDLLAEQERLYNKLLDPMKDFILTLDKMSSEFDRATEASKNLSLVTDQFVARAGGSNNILKTPQSRIFGNSQAYSDAEVEKRLKELGFDAGSEISKKFFGARRLETELPELLLEAQRRPMIGDKNAEMFVRDSLSKGGILGGVLDDQTRSQVSQSLDKLFGEDSQKTLKEFIDEGGLADLAKNLNIRKKQEEFLTKLEEERIRLIDRQVDLANTRVQLEDQLNKQNFQLLTKRQDLQSGRSSLFGKEKPLSEVGKENQERLKQITGGATDISTIIRTLLGAGGLIQQRDILERAGTDNPESLRKLEELNNAINVNVSALNEVSTNLEELSAIQKEANIIQSRRESGRKALDSLSQFSGRFERRFDLKNLKRLQSGEQLGSFGLQGASRGLSELKSLIGNAPTQAEIKMIDKLEAALAKQQFGATPTQDIELLRGLGFSLEKIALAQTVRGEATKEQKLAKAFDEVSKKALDAAKALGAISNLNIGNAINQTRRENFPGFASGGMVPGNSGRPAIVHGGELIIPKNVVDKGPGAIQSFSRKHVRKPNYGSSFKDGGLVGLDASAMAEYETFGTINGVSPQKRYMDLRQIMKEGYVLPGQDEELKALHNFLYPGTKLRIQFNRKALIYWHNLEAKQAKEEGREPNFVNDYLFFGDENEEVRRKDQRRKPAIMSGFQVRTNDTSRTRVNYASKTDFRKDPEVQKMAEEAFAKDKSRIYFGSSLLEASYNKRNELIDSGQLKQTQEDTARRKRENAQSQSKQNLSKYEQYGNDLARMKNLNMEARAILNSANEQGFGVVSKFSTKGEGFNKALEQIQRFKNINQGDQKTLEKYIIDKRKHNGQSLDNYDIQMDMLLYRENKIREGIRMFNSLNYKHNEYKLKRPKAELPSGETKKPTGYKERYEMALRNVAIMDEGNNPFLNDKSYEILIEAAEYLTQKNRGYDASATFFDILASNEPKALEFRKRLRAAGTTFPGLATGASIIQQGGLAQLHKGETVMPAKVSPDSSNFKELAANMNLLSNEVKRVIGSFGGFSQGKSVEGGSLVSKLDEAINRASETFSNLRIPEQIEHKITGEVNVTFLGQDALTQKIAQEITSYINSTVQQQIASVISPVDGKILTG